MPETRTPKAHPNRILPRRTRSQTQSDHPKSKTIIRPQDTTSQINNTKMLPAKTNIRENKNTGIFPSLPRLQKSLSPYTDSKFGFSALRTVERATMSLVLASAETVAGFEFVY